MNTLKENVTTRKPEIFTTITNENLGSIIGKVKEILSKPTGAVFTSGPTALGMSTISMSSQGVSEVLEKSNCYAEDTDH